MKKFNTIMQQLGIAVMLCLFLPVAFSTEKTNTFAHVAFSVAL